MAVVAVRALSIGRGVFRYLERLASHDVAFRVLAQVRVAIWRRLEALAPAGVTRCTPVTCCARLISDVDATQDLFIRGITPVLAAALVGGGAVTVVPVHPHPGRRGARRRAAGRRPRRAGWPAAVAPPARARRPAASSPPPSPTCWTARRTCTPSAPPKTALAA